MRNFPWYGHLLRFHIHPFSINTPVVMLLHLSSRKEKEDRHGRMLTASLIAKPQYRHSKVMGLQNRQHGEDQIFIDSKNMVLGSEKAFNMSTRAHERSDNIYSHNTFNFYYRYKL